MEVLGAIEVCVFHKRGQGEYAKILKWIFIILQ